MANPTSDRSERDILYDLALDLGSGALTGEQIEDVRRMVDAAVSSAEQLRTVRLSNAAEPPTAFVPYRKED